MSEGRKLRVGLMLDSFDVPAWTHAMIEQIMRSDDAEIVLVVLNTGDVQRPKHGRLASLISSLPFVLYIVYGKWDRRKFLKSGLPDATELKDATDLLAGVPVLEAAPRRSRFSDRLEDADVAAVGRYDLDVLVCRGFRILRGEILHSARHGVWSFHHGDNRVNRGGPPGFWEVFLRQPATGSILQILNEDLDNGTVLCRSYWATDLNSVQRNLNAMLWKSLHFLPRTLRRLRRLGDDAFRREIAQANRHPGFYSNRLYTRPTNRRFVWPLLRHLARKVKSRLRRTFRFEQWRLAFCFSDGISTSLRQFKQIVPPRDRFWADPHVVFKDGSYYIFIEEFIYAAGKAHISVIVMDEHGNYEPPKKVLDVPHHLSYPFTFEHHGEYYMVPESSDRSRIDVYRCTRFPDSWEFHTTLIAEVQAADATLFHHENRWWMFVNIAAGIGCSSCDELFLFYSDEVLGNHWTPHMDNPVVSDVRRARPAGGIFQHNGKFYRPAQDCSGGYGHRMRINEILALTTTEYAEREVARIEPNWDESVRGVHHISHAGRLTVIDFKTVRY